MENFENQYLIRQKKDIIRCKIEKPAASSKQLKGDLRVLEGFAKEMDVN